MRWGIGAGIAAVMAIAGPALAISPPTLATVAAAPAGFDGQVTASKIAMMAEPAAALSHALAAATFAQAKPAGPDHDLALATAQWLEGEASTRLRKPADALALLNPALTTVQRLKPNSKLQGDLLKSRGRAFAAQGKVQQALADYHEAFRIYQRANEPRSEAMALQEIGSVYGDARDYAHVLQYYAQSSEVFSADPALSLTSHNNRGSALKNLGRYPEALVEFRAALAAAEQLKSGYLQAHILNNIADTEALNSQPAAARADVNRGLALAASDPEARSERPFLLGVLAKVESDAGAYGTAAALLDRAFAGVDLTKSGMDYRDFHEIAAKVYDRAGRQGLALEHLKAFKRLDDQGRELAANTNAALMAAQFDFANQDLKITKLKAGQLERDMALAGARARMHTLILMGILIAAFTVLAVALAGFVSMRKSRDRIQTANDQLGVSNTALEKALKAKTEFLATTSHEIRTPLNGILGMTQVILADRATPSGVREKLQLVQGAGETMKSLVDDLLDVAKVETGAISISREPFDLGQALLHTVSFWTGQAQAKGLSLLLNTADAPRRIVGDESRLRQVLFNLMSNALKFTESGEVHLCVAPSDNGQTLVLQVRDSGIGIAAEDHERIFEAFTQVDGGTSRKYGGTGLGLSICRSVVTAMGGTIAVSSEAGAGATFTVRLPLTLAGADAVEAEEPPGLASTALLVFETNPLAQGMLRAVLASACRSLTFAPDMATAMETLASARIDLIFADGPALIALGDVKAAVGALRGERNALKVVATLPAACAAEAPGLVAAGVDQVIVKPISASDLIARLDAVARSEAVPAPVAAAA